MLSNANNTMHTTTYLYCFVGFNSDVPLTLRGVPLLLLRPSKDDLWYGVSLKHPALFQQGSAWNRTTA
jgi:hypothetical protein